jgi:BolA protein
MSATPKNTIIDEMRAALERAFSPLSLEILDDSARHAGHAGARSGGHFRVALVSRSFAGRPALERHRMVYEALAPLMGHGIHALNISATAPRNAPRPAP